jgi:thiamine biosynthesis lipoprotein
MAPGDVRARERVRAAIDRELALVDRLFSDRDPESEVSRLNARGSAEPFPVSADTVAVLELARRASELTGGAFDVTAAPLAAALLVLGPDAGRALAAREGLAARLVLRQPDGSYAEWPTPAFEGRLAPPR